MGLFDGTPLERPVPCPQCGQDIKLCGCAPPPESSADQTPEVELDRQRVKVRVEKRKRGKMMTVVAGWRGPASSRQQMLTRLKNHCGAGGTLSDDNIEIQGDHLQRVRDYLTSEGVRLLR